MEEVDLAEDGGFLASYGHNSGDAEKWGDTEMSPQNSSLAPADQDASRKLKPDDIQ